MTHSTDSRTSQLHGEDGSLPRIDQWIGGRPATSSSGREGLVFDPALGAPSARVAFASAADVDAAVAAARAAFETWSRTGLGRRATVLFNFRDLVSRHADDIARCIVREHGKVLADARGEV